MTFIQEPTHYQKTILSDLQGAWVVLRSSVVDHADLENSDKLLFHIDEAMSWESVRNLQIMKSTFIIIRNIAVQSGAHKDILEAIEDIQYHLDDALQSLADGELDL